MKYQPTPAQTAYLTNRDHPRSTTEGLKLSMILSAPPGPPANPQTININTDIYVAASTTRCSIFVKGRGPFGRAHIPSPGIIYEIWRLLNRKG